MTDIPLSEIEQSFIDESPPGLFPQNFDSNFGVFRKTFCDELADASNQIDLLYNERWPNTSTEFFNFHEEQAGLPLAPPSLNLRQRQELVALRNQRGPFTPQLRNSFIEFFINVQLVPGSPVIFGVLGKPIGSGLPLFSGLSGDVELYYTVVENITSFSYDVYIDQAVGLDTVGLTRELTRITPAGISFTINLVHDPFMAKTGTLTVSGNEITDTNRTAALSWGTSQSGGSTDGLSIPGGLGIYPARTNFYRRGQNDSVTGDITFPVAGTTAAVDATTAPPYSTQSVKVTTDGSLAFQGVLLNSATGQAAAVGAGGGGFLWWKGVNGASYHFLTRWTNTDASVTNGSSFNLTSNGQWQSLRVGVQSVQSGKTGDKIGVLITTNGTRAESFWVAHPMLEIVASVGLSLGQSPYIATSGGSTASRSAPRVQAPVSFINPTQGWIAVRLRSGFSTNTAVYGAAQYPTVFSFGDDANNILSLTANTDLPKWQILRASGGTSSNVAITNTVGAGGLVTLVFAWTATQIKLSINGAAFVTVANTNIPTLSATLFDIGTMLGSNPIFGSMIWLAHGNGILTDTDASNLNTLGNAIPKSINFSDASQMNMVVPCDNNMFYVAR